MEPTGADPSACDPAVEPSARPPEPPNRCYDYGISAWRRFQLVNLQPKPKPISYPPISSVPRTSADRLSQPDAVPTPFPVSPATAPGFDALAPPQPATFLYLAYGSNLAAETFLGRRGIRPISQINVSAPSLRLVFDLPGLPYREPCFANTAIRKIPGTPPKLPPGVPDIPDLPDPPHHHRRTPLTGGWNKGLIGVVYEVTPADFAKIIATEGGGSSYHEILVPCIPLPPAVTVPEKPPVPELPKPFIARTLYAPRLPDLPDKEGGDGEKRRSGNNKNRGDDNDGDGDDPKYPAPPEPPSWFRRLLLPVRRPDPEYAQPSARYLKLIADGAREHDLPGEYQEYLQSLQAYTITTRRQRLGQVLFLGFLAPMFLIVMQLSRLLADERGKTPMWFGAAMSIVLNLVWMCYDVVGKPLFGDGERTIEDEKDEILTSAGRRRPLRRNSLWRRLEKCDDEEKRCLLGSMSE